MNSRQRRKQAAQEHNDRIELMKELRELQLAIYVKHGAMVRLIHGDSSAYLRAQIGDMRRVLESDTPPHQESRKSKAMKRGLSTGLALAYLAGMGVM